ncbi:MAG: glycosyltransferase [Victivallaceae bacterium]|nr:glycosyltransferase [Victivallaceae bacterium]
MKLGVYTRYDRLGASSRLRFFNWREALTRAGYEPEYRPFFDRAYLQRLYGGNGKSKTAWCKGLARRLSEMRSAPERLLIEYELLPGVPWPVERAFLGQRRYVAGFDDDVRVKYERVPGLRAKFDHLAAHAAGVIAANTELYNWLKPLNPATLLLPTVDDAARYPAGAVKFPVFTVVWVGTPVTYRYLQKFAPVLQRLATEVDFELLVVASTSLKCRAIPGVPMRFAEWSEATCGKLLARSHLGIMPLTDDGFSRGKSAFKLIQYMLSGIPAVASPVGENKVVLRDGETGFWADTIDDWRRAFARLRNDDALRERMGRAARCAGEEYTYAAREKGFMEFLHGVLDA